jgi:hypothetical protein
MYKKTLGFFLIILIMSVNVVYLPKSEAAATVPLSITINGNLVLSDADNDTGMGINPTKNVNISLTPDVGHTTQSGSANFRIRTNRTSWRLTAQRTASDTGGTGITDADVKVSVAKSAGTNANVNSGTLVAPFTGQTALSSITTASAVDVVSGTAKTSSAKDFANTNNWLQIGTTYSVDPDFFYSPGTFSSTITYNLVSP